MAFPIAYSRYQKVVIQSSKVSADETDYVLYVALSDLSKAGADIFDICQTDGGDIRVTKDDEVTQLARQVVDIDTVGKTGALYVKYAGTLSSSVNTTIFIWYNGSDTEPATSATYGRDNVWTGYNAVIHLSEANNTDSNGYVDSSGNGEHGTGVSMANSEVAGILEYDAQDLDGSGDYVYSDPSAFDVSEGTLSFWVKPVNWSAGGGDNVVIIYYATSLSDRFWIRHNTSDQWEVGFENGGVDDIIFFADSGFTFTTGNWYHFQVTWDDAGNSVKFYVNSVEEASTTTINNSGLVFSNYGYIGAYTGGTISHEGLMSSFRLSGTEFTSDRITTDWNNQNDPDTFYTTGDEFEFPAIPAFGMKIDAFNLTNIRSFALRGSLPPILSHDTLTTSLVSYWKLDLGTWVDSHGANDLTEGGTVTNTTGKINDGATASDWSTTNRLYISDASQTNLEGTGDFSILMWVLSDDAPSALEYIVSKYDTSSQRGYSFNFDTGVVKLFVSETGSSANDQISFTHTHSTVAWTSYVWTYDASAKQHRLYINGSEHGSSPQTGVVTSVHDSTADFQIGVRDGASNAFVLDGDIDEVGFWTKVLTSDEVTDLYNAGNALPYN